MRAPLSVAGVDVCSILSQAMSHHSLEPRFVLEN